MASVSSWKTTATRAGGGAAPTPRAAAAPLASSDALVLQGVTRAFGALRAVDDVSLAVAAGQKYAVLGSNGWGGEGGLAAWSQDGGLVSLAPMESGYDSPQSIAANGQLVIGHVRASGWFQEPVPASPWKVILACSLFSSTPFMMLSDHLSLAFGST